MIRVSHSNLDMSMMQVSCKVVVLIHVDVVTLQFRPYMLHDTGHFLIQVDVVTCSLDFTCFLIQVVF